jgi:16S rRNA (uracil1498-N3)-methyltransferase
VSAPLFFVEALEDGSPAALGDEDARHAVRSLRLRPGDEVLLADGAGAVARGTLREEGASTVVDVAQVRRVTRASPLVGVALAPPKGDRLTWAVQKLTEVGADEIVLIESERAVRHWEGDRGERARGRLESVARQAAMQSRRAFVPSVAGPRSLRRAVEGGRDAGDVVVLWEGATAPLADALRPEAAGILLVVGPEGGFSEREAKDAAAAGAGLASLGEGILRTETAALAATVVALHRLGRLG